MRRRWSELPRAERLLLAFYTVAAAGALVLTWWNNIEFFTTDGNDGLTGFIAAGFANPAAASLTLDVVFVGVVLQVFMVIEGRRIGMSLRTISAFVVAAAVVAVSVALPLFLVARHLKLTEPAQPERS